MSEFKLSVLIVRESVPPDVAITSQISDLVIIDRTATPAKVVLLDAANMQPVTGNWRDMSCSPWTSRTMATPWPTCPWKSGAGVSSTRETP